LLNYATAACELSVEETKAYSPLTSDKRMGPAGGVCTPLLGCEPRSLSRCTKVNRITQKNSTYGVHLEVTYGEHKSTECWKNIYNNPYIRLLKQKGKLCQVKTSQYYSMVLVPQMKLRLRAIAILTQFGFLKPKNQVKTKTIWGRLKIAVNGANLNEPGFWDKIMLEWSLQTG